MRVAAAAVIVRWPVSLLAGLLGGLQRFGPLNVAKGVHAAVSFGTGALVLLVWHDVVLFAAWLVLSAAIELSLYLFAVRGATSSSLTAEGPDLRAIRHYAAGIAVITVLSLILTQSDRIVLARLV